MTLIDVTPNGCFEWSKVLGIATFLVRTFFADFYAEVLPGRDLKVAAC